MSVFETNQPEDKIPMSPEIAKEVDVRDSDVLQYSLEERLHSSAIDSRPKLKDRIEAERLLHEEKDHE
jgi:hypothetical protein